jgi:hypothetical protein
LICAKIYAEFNLAEFFPGLETIPIAQIYAAILKLKMATTPT